MKKIIMTLVLCISCMCAYAGLDIKVANGDKKFFKNTEGKAIVEINWDGATFDGRMSLAEKFGDMTDYAAASKNGFTESFNDESKKLKVVQEAKDAQYKFTIQITKVDQYFKVMGFVPGNATKIWGTLIVTDIATGQQLVEVIIDEVDGGASPSPTETFSDSFEELAEQLTKLK